MTLKQLETLKKLTALANNNPNENEANLAARKVCKMLADSNFILSVTTWNDVTRSTEPGIKSTRPASSPTSKRPVYAHYNARYRSWEDIFNYNPTEQQDRTYDGRANRVNRAQQTRDLKCQNCGAEVQTNYIGNPSTFFCFGCWAK